MKKIFFKLFENFKKAKNKLVLSIIYLFLFSPIFITFILNRINIFCIYGCCLLLQFFHKKTNQSNKI